MTDTTTTAEFNELHPRGKKDGKFSVKSQSDPVQFEFSEKETLHENGALAEIQTIAANGDIVQMRNFADTLDDDGNPRLLSDQRFTGREHHDPDGDTPAVRTYDEDGTPVLQLRLRHGQFQDPEDGTPALISWSDGREVMHRHYSGGKIQDPAPGVPADVMTLEKGVTRKTFYTAGIATKQVDTLPIGEALGGMFSGLIGEGVSLVSTRER